MWVPAVNGTGAFGRWDYIEVRDPWDAKALIRKYLASSQPAKLVGMR
jgi:type III restriction enzyme